MPEAVLYRVRLPMQLPFDHPAARRTASDGLVLSLTAGGVCGIGECAPRTYVTGETCESVTAQLRRIRLDSLFARLEASPPHELLARVLRDGLPEVFGISGGNNLVCLLETAVLDLLGKATGSSACRLFAGGHGSEPRGDMPGDMRGDTAPLPFSQVLDLSLGAEEFLATRGPFHFVKVKASDDIARDARTVRTLREGVEDGVPIMVDANMSWDPADASDHARRLRDCGADYLEEPLAPRSWDALRTLRRRSGLGIMLDESVCSIGDARAAAGAGACDAVNIRVAKNGGPTAAARLITFAREHGLGFQLGVQVAEVGPLINAGRALAFGNRDALTVEAGQSDRFFPEMIVSPRPEVDRETNTLAPPPGPGLGMSLERSAERWAVLIATGTGAGAGEGWRPVPSASHLPLPSSRIRPSGTPSAYRSSSP